MLYSKISGKMMYEWEVFYMDVSVLFIKMYFISLGTTADRKSLILFIYDIM